jgi:dTDP-glucose pyrophosphorylase
MKSLGPAIISQSASLRDALVALDLGGLQIVLVMDGPRLVGIMTDGDVRRALLAGASLEASVGSYVRRHFFSVAPGTPRAAVLDVMRSRRIAQVPIVGADGALGGLHLLHDIVGGEERPNWAVVMAGGRGTRLGPLTERTPKPMLPVAGRPILERIVLQLVSAGVRRIFLSVNYLRERIEEHFGDGHGLGCRIEYLREERPLGTGGALSLLPTTPTAPLLVMNGDLVTQADLGAMLDFHGAGGQRVTIASHRYHHTVPFGCIERDGERVVGLHEKPTLVREVNAGIYALDPEVLSLVPPSAEIGLPSLVEACIARGDLVRVWEIGDEWIDVGQRDQLRQARGEHS